MRIKLVLPGILLITTALSCGTDAGTAPVAKSAYPPFHTYSIVARDPATGDMGAAVQSHAFAVGRFVIWGEAGVGVAATQSFYDPTYGPLALTLMKAGRTAPQTLKALIHGDPHPEGRQVAILDATGKVAAYTGGRCIPAAGHVVGENFSVQANMMLSDKVWPAMASAFENSHGDLAERLLIALEAAEEVGGDIRGRQAAAILIVRGQSGEKPWADRVMDLRVEDHAEPIRELRRLVTLHRAEHHLINAQSAAEEGNEKAALQEYVAAEELAPGRLEYKFWHAVGLVNMGRVEESFPLFQEIFSQNERWALLLSRLVNTEALQADKETVGRILRETQQ